MNVRRVTEAILTSCLLLSRVWARPTDVVCDGGRGEWDKWFDGCRWCVCQQAGPLCSSAECSRLVTRVAPCQKVDSRWWDGCYHCKCYHHGIECTVDDTCLLLMRNERYALDFLSHDACLDANDGRCVCGADGVPSCTAEVIDRKAHPARTIGLNPIFPAVASIKSPRVAYYDLSYVNNRDIRNDRHSYYPDSLHINHPEGAVDNINNEQLKKHLHSLVRRHARRNKNHSPQVYITKRGRKSQNSKHKPAGNSSSHNRRNSRKHFKENLSGRGFRGRRKQQTADQIYIRGDSDGVFDTDVSRSNDASRLYPQNQWSESYSRHVAGASNIKMYKNAYTDRSDTFPIRKRKEFRELEALVSLNVGEKFKKRTEQLKEETVEAGYLNDDTATENMVAGASGSLLIASDNRCRWGVRWYGGSLRCYCGLENSITCGDPSFVASRIDGFRLETASCEVGQAWDDANNCRACECPIRGVVLCKRSSSCPLPLLIKPLPVDPDEGSHFDRKGDYVDGKGQSSTGHTGEFTGQDVENVEFEKNETSQGGVHKDSDEIEEDNREVDVFIDTNGDNNTTIDVTDGNIKIGGKLDEPNLTLEIDSKVRNEDIGPENKNETIDPENNNEQIDPENYNEQIDPENYNNKIGSENNNNENGSENAHKEISPQNGSRGGDNKKKGSVFELEDGITKHPNVVIKQEDNSTITDVNINVKKHDKGSIQGEKTTNNKLEGVANTDIKRTTQVVVGECKPLSRWLDRCKRCQCDKDGKKHCDDSRCPKPMPVIPVMNNIPQEPGNERSSRPMQRPPPEFHVPRDGPIDLRPTLLRLDLCGRFTVGQKYWDECNICLCTQHGPKCTAKNCA